MFKVLLSSALLLSLLSACQAPLIGLHSQPPAQPQLLQRQSAPQHLQAPLFPVQQGFFWEYGVTLAPVMDPLAEEKSTYTLALEKVTPTPQGTRLELRAQSGFNNRYSFPSLVQSPQGIQLQDMTFLGLGSDEVRGLSIPFVQQPLSPGQRWEDENWIGKVKGLEPVTVPAGTFEAWRIEVIGTYDRAYTAVGDYWLVPGMGVVKSAYTVPNFHIESVLLQAGPRR